MKKEDRKLTNRKKALAKLAMAPATVNVSLIMASAQVVLERCLYAIHNSNITELPMSQMSETLYNRLANQILTGELIQFIDSPELVSFQIIDKDVSVMYAIRSITFQAACHAGGAIRTLSVLFTFDARSGMVLSEIKEMD